MGERQRVLIVAPHFAEYSLRYARALAAHSEVAAVLDEKGLVRDLAGRESLRRGPERLTTNRFRSPADLVRLVWFAVRFRPSALHLQEAAGPRRGVFTAILASVLRRTSRIVLIVHDPLPHMGRDSALARRVRYVRDHLRRRADVVIVHGPSCAAQYRRESSVLHQRVLVGAHGVILEPDVVEPPSPCPLRLLFFGRMESYKGVEVLLDAASILHRNGVAFSLTVAGRGPELDRLSDRFAALPEVRVIHRYVSSTELIGLIQQSECVVLPYLEATQSGVLAAAFAGRRYVVASAVGGLPDVVTDRRNGLLVPPGCPALLAESIQSLISDGTLRKDLLRGADVTATTTLSWDRIAAEIHGALVGDTEDVDRLVASEEGRGR